MSGLARKNMMKMVPSFIGQMLVIRQKDVRNEVVAHVVAYSYFCFTVILTIGVN